MLQYILRKLNSLLFLKRDQGLNRFVTLYVNIRTLPLKDALKFPILIYGKCYAVNLKGSIIFKSKIEKGLLIIGRTDPVRSFDGSSILNIIGDIVIENRAEFRRGFHLQVNPGATFEIGDEVVIGDNTTVICTKSIRLGKYTRIGNNCTFMDTDFHYIVNTTSKAVRTTFKSIQIGENNWIAGYNVVKKGAITPKGTIVAGPYSMIGKDYTSKIGEYCIIGGSPAKLIAENYRRINNSLWQEKLHKYFKEKTEPYFFPEGTDLDKVCVPK